MRAEECTAGYMSPLVRQDLARLDKDGDSRRVALFALKQYVENLDPGSVPRFLAQVRPIVNLAFIVIHYNVTLPISVQLFSHSLEIGGESFEANVYTPFPLP